MGKAGAHRRSSTAGTGNFPAKSCIFMQERALAAPRPVRIAKKLPKSPLPLCGLPLAFWQKCCIIYNIE